MLKEDFENKIPSSHETVDKKKVWHKEEIVSVEWGRCSGQCPSILTQYKLHQKVLVFDCNQKQKKCEPAIIEKNI